MGIHPCTVIVSWWRYYRKLGAIFVTRNHSLSYRLNYTIIIAYEHKGRYSGHTYRFCSIQYLRTTKFLVKIDGFHHIGYRLAILLVSCKVFNLNHYCIAAVYMYQSLDFNVMNPRP